MHKQVYSYIKAIIVQSDCKIKHLHLQSSDKYLPFVVMCVIFFDIYRQFNQKIINNCESIELNDKI